jgi:eukaryotic-like serine/threonine-protein kinase
MSNVIPQTSAIDRYQILRRISAGGTGVVYEADDLERGLKVALKSISKPDVEKIYQLKREFRARVDLSHPNLVALYDLVIAHDSCFFTMELLDGVDLLTHLWGRKVGDPSELAASTLAPMPIASASLSAPPGDDPITASSPRPTQCDLARLRAALPQLARGLHALHTAGKIHRDVKPSNIHVTSDGRVVLLDFGLVAELERSKAGEAFVGTLAYMAPEQFAGDVQLTGAADWYAVGVVLFEALTGRLPFEGLPTRVLFEKQTVVTPRPSLIVQHIPRDLDDLCAELLERDPADRPTGDQLLRRLRIGDPDRIAAPISDDDELALAMSVCDDSPAIPEQLGREPIVSPHSPRKGSGGDDDLRALVVAMPDHSPPIHWAAEMWASIKPNKLGDTGGPHAAAAPPAHGRRTRSP